MKRWLNLDVSLVIYPVLNDNTQYSDVLVPEISPCS